MENFQGHPISDGFIQLFGRPNMEDIGQNPPTGMSGNQAQQLAAAEYIRLITEFKGIVSIGLLWEDQPILAAQIAYAQSRFELFNMRGFGLAKMQTSRGVEFWACFAQTPQWDKILLIDRPFRWRKGLTSALYPAYLIPIYQRNRIQDGFPVDNLHKSLEIGYGAANNQLLIVADQNENDLRLRTMLDAATVS